MTESQHRAMALAIRRACFDQEGRRVRGMDAVLGTDEVARWYGDVALALWRVRVGKVQQ